MFVIINYQVKSLMNELSASVDINSENENRAITYFDLFGTFWKKFDES